MKIDKFHTAICFRLNTQTAYSNQFSKFGMNIRKKYQLKKCSDGHENIQDLNENTIKRWQAISTATIRNF